MSKKPSVPRSGADFDVYFNNIVEYTLERVIAANPVRTHIPKPEALAAACAAWHAVYEKTLIPHSPVVTAEKTVSVSLPGRRLRISPIRAHRWRLDRKKKEVRRAI